MIQRAARLWRQFIVSTCTLAAASAQVIVTGVVTGHDGKPMPTAHVQLVNAANELIDSATLKADGRFELHAQRPGLFRLQFAGPLHGQQAAFIFTDKPGAISLRAQLTAPEYSADFGNLRLSTSDPKSPLNNTRFERQPDGTFAAQIESGLPELQLAVNGLVKNGPPLPLPGQSEYRCFTNLHCYAVAHPTAGKLRIVLDPKLLVRTAEPFRVRYADPDSPVAAAASILDDAEAFNTTRRVARQDTALKLGKALNQVPLEPPPPERVAAVVREIERERVPLARQARLFEYLLLLFLDAPPDRGLVRRALDELTPASPLWALNFGNVAGTAIFATGAPETYVEYAMRIVDAQPTKALKGTAAAGIIASFGENGRAAAAAQLMAKAQAEAGDQNVVKGVLAKYGTTRRIQTGRAVPAFRAPSLDDASSVYTEASLKGKVYLIDFWATWCLPCISEFPGLTKLYERYHGLGFEILSYSIDSKPDLVRQFRKDRFAMPWLHAIDPELREIQSPMAKDFEVVSIPRPLLMDRDGAIIATDQECRGAKLEESLKHLLDPPVRER
jgi:thiol-disulfide isomerase/thioredoxin